MSDKSNIERRELWAAHLFKQIKDPTKRLICIYLVRPTFTALNRAELSEEEITLIQKFERQLESLSKRQEQFRKIMLERKKNKMK